MTTSDKIYYVNFGQRFVKKLSIFALFISWNFFAAFNAQAEIHCYSFPKTKGFSLGFGFLSAQGQVFCDDGSSGTLTLKGWQILNINFAFGGGNTSNLVFSQIDNIDEIKGVYQGAGVQVAVPLFGNAGMAVFKKDKAILNWSSPVEEEKELGLGIPYKNFRVDVSEVKSPSVLYTQTIEELSKLQLESGPDQKLRIKREGKQAWVSSFTDSQKNCLGMELSKEEGLVSRTLYKRRHLRLEHLFISKVPDALYDDSVLGTIGEQIEAQGTYLLEVSCHTEMPAIYYQYRFTVPAKTAAQTTPQTVPSTSKRIFKW